MFTLKLRGVELLMWTMQNEQAPIALSGDPSEIVTCVFYFKIKWELKGTVSQTKWQFMVVFAFNMNSPLFLSFFSSHFFQASSGCVGFNLICFSRTLICNSRNVCLVLSERDFFNTDTLNYYLLLRRAILQTCSDAFLSDVWHLNLRSNIDIKHCLKG